MENPVVQIGRSVKRVTLQRVLCSVLAFEGRTSGKLVVALYQNQLWLESKILKDITFRKRYGDSISELSDILKEVNLSRGITDGAQKGLGQRILQRIPGFLLPRRNYKTELLKYEKTVSVRPYRSAGTPTNQLPPKKVIGKGYGLGGTARDESQDGNPRWQEVGAVYSNLERQLAEAREKLKEAIDEPHNLPDTVRQIGIVLELHQQLRRIEQDPTRGSSSSSKAPKGQEETVDRKVKE